MKHVLAMLPTLAFAVSKKGNQKMGKGLKERKKESR
jgi:hypothetical protein